MKSFRTLTLTVLAAAVLGACAGMPANSMLDQARSDYREAQANGQTPSLAPAELRQAGDALARAEAAQARSDGTATVNQLAYLAGQRVALANQTAGRKIAEAEVAAASSERDALRLAARTREADLSARNAAAATRDATAANSAAAESQRQSEAAMRQTANAQQQAAASRQQAADANRQALAAQQQASSAKQQATEAQTAALASQQQTAALQQQATEAEQRRLALEKQLSDLNAKKTERGMVITMGDVLFDTGAAQLKPGGLRNIERLSDFLKKYPQRKAMVEGYTDSIGSDSSNQVLSERRAASVMTALINMGVARNQLSSQGYGEARPVAGNDSSGGRQMNRRVEIVLSDEAGVLSQR